jgi:hypothetical protein
VLNTVIASIFAQLQLYMGFAALYGLHI